MKRFDVEKFSLLGSSGRKILSCMFLTEKIGRNRYEIKSLTAGIEIKRASNMKRK